MTGYRAEQARFADWCASRGYGWLPAAPGVVLAYLEAERPAGGTAARWVAGIRAAHAAAGMPDPCGGSAAAWVRNARAQEPAGERELARLAGRIPESGWPSGLPGRRDRLAFLLRVLGAVPATVLAGLPAQAVASVGRREVTLIAGDGTALLVRGLGDDPVLCPACAAIRWAEALSISARFGRVAPLLHGRVEAGHLCERHEGECSWPAKWPLLPAIDRWGHPPLPPVPTMSVRAVEEMLLGCAQGTRAYPQQQPKRRRPEPRRPPPPPAPVIPAAPGWHEAGVAARTRALASMGGVDDLLERLEAAADKAAERSRLILESGAEEDDSR